MPLPLPRMMGLAALVLCLVLGACKKSSSSASDTTVVDDYTAASTESQGATALADNLFTGSSGKNDAVVGVFKNCISSININGVPTTVVDTSTGGINAAVQHTVIVSFSGSAGCGDAKVRTGSLTYTWLGAYSLWRNPQRVLTITSHNYTVNGNLHSIHKTITSYPADAANNVGPYNLTIASDTITYADKTQSTWQASRKEQWVAGWRTLNPFLLKPDVSTWQVSITGSGTGGQASTGVTQGGVNYVETIKTPLLVHFDCAYPIEQGSIFIQDSGLNTYLVDFGNNTCINAATYTITVNGGTPFAKKR